MTNAKSNKRASTTEFQANYNHQDSFQTRTNTHIDVTLAVFHWEMSWLKLDASLNMYPIYLTLAVFHWEMSWLKLDASLNIENMRFTLAVFQAPMLSLKVVRPRNKLPMSLTAPVSQRLILGPAHVPASH